MNENAVQKWIFQQQLGTATCNYNPANEECVNSFLLVGNSALVLRKCTLITAAILVPQLLGNRMDINNWTNKN